MADPANKAIFLSYASQDESVARQLCEALRAAGIEVWFDQSELRGGEAWDASIRRQIRDCALFVPLVSAGTQQRREEYFLQPMFKAGTPREMFRGPFINVPGFSEDVAPDGRFLMLMPEYPETP